MHAVHIQCISTSRAAATSVSEPCFVCRTPAYAHALESCLISFPQLASVVQLPEPPPLVDHVVVCPLVVPLCCSRIVGQVDGQWVSDHDDKRMRYLGIQNGQMVWTCLGCDRSVLLRHLPALLNQQVCRLHGQMCYVMDAARDATGGARVADCDARDAARGRPLRGYETWFCCCSHTDTADVPIIIAHDVCVVIDDEDDSVQIATVSDSPRLLLPDDCGDDIAAVLAQEDDIDAAQEAEHDISIRSIRTRPAHGVARGPYDPPFNEISHDPEQDLAHEANVMEGILNSYEMQGIIDAMQNIADQYP